MAAMTPLTFEILLALADSDRHGYGIIKEIERRSRATATPSTGALYLALQRMEGEGLIERVETAEPGADRRRRYYGLTAKGRAHGEAESLRLADLVGSARTKKLLPREVT